MTNYDLVTTSVSRRDALRISLATASLLIVAGCQSNSAKALKSANKDLRKTLAGMAANDVQSARLASISRRLESRSRELMEDHLEFQDNFDTLSILPEVSSADLKRLGSEYQARRITLRNDLLRLQDELRAELTAEEWDEVVDALNKKAKSVARDVEKG